MISSWTRSLTILFLIVSSHIGRFLKINAAEDSENGGRRVKVTSFPNVTRYHNNIINGIFSLVKIFGLSFNLHLFFSILSQQFLQSWKSPPNLTDSLVRPLFYFLKISSKLASESWESEQFVFFFSFQGAWTMVSVSWLRNMAMWEIGSALSSSFALY